jgi:hypothetical protein
MRRLFVFVVLVIAVAACVGYYRGWFHFSNGSADGKDNPSITLDKGRIKADEDKAKEKVEDLGQKVKERSNAGTDQTKEAASRP